MINHSFFDTQSFDRMVQHYHDAGYTGYPRVLNYEQFDRLYPQASKANLHERSEKLRRAGGLRQCYLISSSGTTASPLVVASDYAVGELRDAYSLEIRRFLGQRVFSSRDVVANLLVPGGFGCLYEGFSRLLEPIGCTLLPVGRLDAQDCPQTCLQICRDAGVSALLATPGGIIQAAHWAVQAHVKLDIRKVIYIGEAFSAAKQHYIRTVWPNAAFYGLYGNTEVGLVGVSTPQHPPGHYDFLSKWVLAEVDEQGKLYLSDLKAPRVPVLRYDTGDLATLLPTSNPRVGTLVLHGRSDKSFNFCGNLLSLSQVSETIWQRCGQPFALQLTLSSGDAGRDHLCVTGDLTHFTDAQTARADIESALMAMPALAEGLRRGVATIQVEPDAAFWVSAREKVPTLRDLRQT
ncbi:hypothetical protein C9383_03215 [Pseudomonas palleroniana]|uniref:Indoleacetate---lysine synthetase n=1 Tax=Pseudomonas palleroniana TaxID=191390 RepID=A0A1H5N705_9PSED|nr:hypothetical protein [Pseudomonas palleroniana]KAB0569730.1 hypothetical protein F7R03_00940 [Pseudomonas palleroniana]PTC31252.1 hypothetical protein C9383_03215 [Pseudomonas palleroniana]SEE97316.1 indoleacetate---lysine synthetase [Pseudomonas palleroniana]